MNQYYLISQLPSLETVNEGSAIPITEERFFDLCERFLSKKAKQALEKLTLAPPIDFRPTGFDLIDNWNSIESQLRLALANVRSSKLKRGAESDKKTFSYKILQTAQTAVEMTDPLQAEQLLNKFRLEALESLRPADAFSESAVFYYGLKLKLISRMKRFENKAGQENYRNLYNSIMSGDNREEQQ